MKFRFRRKAVKEIDCLPLVSLTDASRRLRLRPQLLRKCRSKKRLIDADDLAL